MVKKDSQKAAPAAKTPTTSSIPVIAMILGITSLTTFTWFLGVPAIILGIIGMRRYAENRGLSIAGLITGIISTLLMIGAFLLFIGFLIVAIVSSDTDTYSDEWSPDYSEQEKREYGERLWRDYYRENM